jgi:hypothetical protein
MVAQKIKIKSDLETLGPKHADNVRDDIGEAGHGGVGFRPVGPRSPWINGSRVLWARDEAGSLIGFAAADCEAVASVPDAIDLLAAVGSEIIINPLLAAV